MFDLTPSKLVPLDSRLNMMLIKLSLNSFIVDDFSCPGCGTNYIGKTERTLYERTVEHAWTDNKR